ncbi:MAG: hypothetical protein K0Q73_7918, partial [Paenibacillus sp.]|nr:hypothetical protein [Paenibacillus sp.]
TIVQPGHYGSRPHDRLPLFVEETGDYISESLAGNCSTNEEIGNMIKGERTTCH